MSAIYARMAATAIRLLTMYGRAMALHRPSATDPVYDDDTGAVTPVTPTTYPCTGAAFDFEQREIDGTRIRAGDQRLYIAPDIAVTPRTGDLVEIGGASWAVLTSNPLAPAGPVVLHVLHVRLA